MIILRPKPSTRSPDERGHDLAVLLQIIHRAGEHRLERAGLTRLDVRNEVAEVSDHLRLNFVSEVIHIAVVRIECTPVDVRLAHDIGHGDAWKVFLLHQTGQRLPQQLFGAPYSLVLLYRSCHFTSPPFRLCSDFSHLRFRRMFSNILSHIVV